MPTGMSIKIFLPDGDPEGVRLVYKSHWTGIGVATSRSRYAEARRERNELRSPGVYVLVGPAENARFGARIYIGQSENPQARIDDHHTSKDFWNRLVVFTSYGQALNKATICYLEASLLKLADDAGRAELDNRTIPGLPPLSEPDIADAKSFLTDMLVILPVLGVSAFEPLDQTPPGERLRLETRDASAEGVENEEGFVVFSGARARATTIDSMPGWALSLRESLVRSGALASVEGGASLTLTTDHVFKSPSAAADVLLGRSVPGPLVWKDASGRTLKELREQALGTLAPPAGPTDGA